MKVNENRIQDRGMKKAILQYHEIVLKKIWIVREGTMKKTRIAWIGLIILLLLLLSLLSLLSFSVFSDCPPDCLETTIPENMDWQNPEMFDKYYML